MGIERIMLALERQGLQKPKIEKDVFVAYEAGRQDTAIQRVQELRQKGRTAELALAAQTEEEARCYQEGKGYTSLEYIS